MKFNIKNKISSCYLLFALSCILIASCKNNAKENAAEATKSILIEEEHHEEIESAISSLTDDQIKAVGIQYGRIEQKQLTATLKVNGTLKVPNNNKANATSLYGGVIKSIHVSTGALVKKGQIIATISHPQIIQLQEEYLNSASKLVYAEQELSRQKELNEGNAGSLKNLQLATIELNNIQTRRASLYQQIQLMEINPNNISIGNLKSLIEVKSPINGTISNILSKIGSYVDVSSPVAEIVDNGSLHLDLNVFEKDLSLLRVGQIIHFTLTNNPTQEYDAKIFSIGTSFENETKTIPIHCDVQGNKIGLIDGMNITAIVSLNNITTAAVPNDAIVEDQGKYFIFVLTDKIAEDEHPAPGTDQHENSVNKTEKHHQPNDMHNHLEVKTTNFEKIEVIKGISNIGYSAITFISEKPKGTKIITKGAFFVNAKMSNQGEEHAH